MWLWIWLVVAVAAAIGEALTYDLFLASVAGAALLTAITVLILPGAAQVGVFAVLSLLGIFVVRPAAKAALGLNHASNDSIGVRHTHVIGRRAVVTQTVTLDGGQIRIGQGEFWSARAYEPTDRFEPGDPVRVVLIEGVTALVEPILLTSGSDTDVSNHVLSQKGTLS
jgi:membrane protein implicated in regulation of membrane protease activity